MSSNPSVGYNLRGPGGSCGTWTVDRRSNEELAMLDLCWVLGFLTSIGYNGLGDPLNGVDAEGVGGWVDNYCQAHPIDEIVDAAQAFYRVHPR